MTKKPLSDVLGASLRLEDSRSSEIVDRAARASQLLEQTATTPVPDPVKRAPKVKHSTFSLPEESLELLEVLRQRALDFRTVVNKSELVRAGLACLAGLSSADLEEQLASLERLKPGRKPS